jgi:hypothetical protein
MMKAEALGELGERRSSSPLHPACVVRRKPVLLEPLDDYRTTTENAQGHTQPDHGLHDSEQRGRRLGPRGAKGSDRCKTAEREKLS